MSENSMAESNKPLMKRDVTQAICELMEEFSIQAPADDPPVFVQGVRGNPLAEDARFISTINNGPIFPPQPANSLTKKVDGKEVVHSRCQRPECTNYTLSLSACGKCHQVFYCSKRCQKLHWKNIHQHTCRGLVKAAEVTNPACALCDELFKIDDQVANLVCPHFCHTKCLKSNRLSSNPETDCPKCAKSLDDGSYFYAALVAMLNQDFDLAETLLWQQTEQTPEHLESKNYLTLALLYQVQSAPSPDDVIGIYEVISCTLEEMLERDRENPFILLRMGLCQRGLNNLESALGNFKQALLRLPVLTQAWVGVITCQFCLGKRADALASAEAAVKKVPEDDVLQRFLYVMYKANSKSQQAKALAKKLKKQKKECEEFDVEYSQLLLFCFQDQSCDEQEADKFSRWMKGVLAISSCPPWVRTRGVMMELLTSALVWLKMGKFVELAQTILLFIVEQNPENEIALMLLCKSLVTISPERLSMSRARKANELGMKYWRHNRDNVPLLLVLAEIKAHLWKRGTGPKLPEEQLLAETKEFEQEFVARGCEIPEHLCVTSLMRKAMESQGLD